ncbi:hypothetical protein [Micromonospora sp. WMMA1976]|uniref:hypothetical protein n=1 Tax=Micromonospora sp. WMMA1976 TaxID=3014995 RepID=UPI00248C2DC0|nr:hypothetical protein [Micromonospora sp. WMMA1976]WBC05307.1 hypothetical protein O7546_10220 [Micromonospora sp. WMMA1976]
MAGTWEQCVREVTLSADPDLVGEVGIGWNNLSTTLGYLRDALVGRSFVGPIAPGVARPHTDGLPGMLAGWTGSGGDAYREHLSDIGRSIEELTTTASNVGGALSRIGDDIRKAVASIPIPLVDDFGVNEWSLPNGGELDDANDGENASAFLAALRADYRSDPSSYADGAFREKADDLEATMKVDGQASDQKRGGLWDTSSHLNNWYRDNQQVAISAMAPLAQALETERPRLGVPEADDSGSSDGYRPRIPPSGHTPTGLDGVYGGGDSAIGGVSGSGGSAAIGSSTGLGGSGSSSGNSTSVAVPSTAGRLGNDLIGRADSYLPPLPRDDGPAADLGLGTSLAGAPGPTTVGGGLGGAASVGLGSQSPLGGGAGFGLSAPSAAGGVGLGAGGGIGAGGTLVGGGVNPVGVPGMVGGGNGRVPPMTSAANALRNATGAGRAGTAAASSRGSAGGMIGGSGAAGRGGGSEYDEPGPESSWLTEDDDPWGRDDTGSPGILR